MNDVTMLIQQIEAGNRKASDELLPLIYGELRRLAQHRLDRNRGGGKPFDAGDRPCPRSIHSTRRWLKSAALGFEGTFFFRRGRGDAAHHGGKSPSRLSLETWWQVQSCGPFGIAGSG